MDWWMAGLVPALLLALAVRDVGRPGRATAPALLLLRAVGGIGLMAMGALSLRAGSAAGGLVAAVGAAPLLAGLTGGLLRPRETARAVRLPARAPAAARAAGDDERRAA